MITQLTFIHALSPLHAGIGQGVGVIDLPVAREKATGLPFLPGSSLKGTLRSLCSDDDRASIFGPATTETDSNYASSVQFSDQRLLLLPVRSLAGTFAWVTSPYVLRRLLRDITDTHTLVPSSLIIPEFGESECCVCDENGNESSRIVISTDKVYLEDLDLIARKESTARDWAAWIGQQVFKDQHEWQRLFIQRFCIVHDDVFSFLLDTATEITARIKLQEESKTVQGGGLWYEEALPAETILAGLAIISPSQAANRNDQWIFDKLTSLMGKTVQFGGKATVGRGLCRVYLAADTKGSR